MAANMERMADMLKVIFAQDISASAVKVTSSINETISKKVDQLSSWLNDIKVKVTCTKTLADDKRVRIEHIEGERDNSSSKLE